MQLGILLLPSQFISMKLPSGYLNKFTSNLLKRKEQAEGLRKIAQRGDWREMVKKCHARLTEEYRFWIAKSENSTRSAKLSDLSKDIAFVKAVEGKEKVDESQFKKLKELVNKYGL